MSEGDTQLVRLVRGKKNGYLTTFGVIGNIMPGTPRPRVAMATGGYVFLGKPNGGCWAKSDVK